MKAFATISLSETDRRALIILLIVLVVVLLILGLIGWAVRVTMRHQAKKADNFMHDATITHVVDTPAKFRRLGIRKNNRLFYKQSLIPFLIALVGLIVWLITGIATKDWAHNMWADLGDLFFAWNWNEEGLFVNVFGLTLLSRWPSVSHTPTYIPEHTPYYIMCFLWIIAALYYAYNAQAYISRHVMIMHRAGTVFEKSLAGYRANEDIKVRTDKPLPPTDE